MLKKWQKLENSINTKLNSWQKSLYQLFIRLTPKFIFKFFHKMQNKFIDTYIWFRDTFVSNIIDGKDWTIYQKDRIFNLLTYLQNYNYGNKARAINHALAAFFSLSPKQHWKNIKAVSKHISEKTALFIKKFNGGSIGISIVAVLLFAIGMNLIVGSGKFIWLSENPHRKPASVEDVRKRPDYHFLDKKSFVVLNIKVPIFAKDINRVTAVTIDFGVRTSNRFATLFLTEYEYKLKDHFFMTMHPIESSFPIESEGKQVIREKILHELNEFLKQENVEGHVEEVTIMYIIAT